MHAFYFLQSFRIHVRFGFVLPFVYSQIVLMSVPVNLSCDRFVFASLNPVTLTFVKFVYWSHKYKIDFNYVWLLVGDNSVLKRFPAFLPTVLCSIFGRVKPFWSNTRPDDLYYKYSAISNYSRA